MGLIDQLEALTGEITNVIITQHALVNGARYILDLAPQESLERYANVYPVSSNGLDVMRYRVLRTECNGYGAKYGLPGLRNEYINSNSLFKATPTDPVYTIAAGKLYIYPDGGVLIGVEYPDFTDINEIENRFNPIIIKGIIYYAAIEVLYFKIKSAFESLLAREVTYPALPTIPSITYEYYDVSTGSIETVTFDVPSFTPTFTKPSLTLTTAPNTLSLSGITIPSAPDSFTLDPNITPPTIPTLNDITYTDANLGTFNTVTLDNLSIPNFTPPALIYSSAPDPLDLSSITLPTLPGDLDLSSITPPSAPTLPEISYTDAALGTFSTVNLDSLTIPSYTKPTNNISFTNLETYISTEEDGEKAIAEVQQIEAKISNLQQNIYNELNKFNSDIAAQKLILEKSVEKARLDLEKIITEASKTTDLNLQNKYNQLRALIEKSTILLNQYINDLTLYQTQINKKVSEYGSNLEKTRLSLQKTELELRKALEQYAYNLQRFTALRTSEIEKYRADIENESAKFNALLNAQQLTLQRTIEQNRLNLEKILTEASKTTDLNLQNKYNQLRASIENNNQLLTKFANELELYRTKVNNALTIYAQNLDRYRAQLSGVEIELNKQINEYNANLERYAKITVNELQKYQLDITNERAKLESDIETFRMYVEKMLEKARIDRDRVIEQARITKDVELQNALNNMNKQIAEAEAKLKAADESIALYNAEINRLLNNENMIIEKTLKSIENDKLLIEQYRNELKSIVSML